MEIVKKKIVVLASGGGSNAQRIIDHFQNSTDVTVCAVISNKSEAGALERARLSNIDTHVVKRLAMLAGELNSLMLTLAPDLIVLAGFLLKVPEDLLLSYPDKIVNIHPSLLPAFGGKGMYGAHVMKAVLDAGERHSGITIHLVNNEYDKGRVVAQVSCPVMPTDTVDTLQKRIQALEHKYFPLIIEDILK